MPNLYEKVVAIPDPPPVQLSGTLPAGSCSGFPPAIPFGQILILSGASAGSLECKSQCLDTGISHRWTKRTG